MTSEPNWFIFYTSHLYLLFNNKEEATNMILRHQKLMTSYYVTHLLENSRVHRKQFFPFSLLPNFIPRHTCSGRALSTSLRRGEVKGEKSGSTAGIRIWWKCLRRNYPQQTDLPPRNVDRVDRTIIAVLSTTSGRSWKSELLKFPGGEEGSFYLTQFRLASLSLQSFRERSRRKEGSKQERKEGWEYVQRKALPCLKGKLCL